MLFDRLQRCISGSFLGRPPGLQPRPYGLMGNPPGAGSGGLVQRPLAFVDHRLAWSRGAIEARSQIVQRLVGIRLGKAIDKRVQFFLDGHGCPPGLFTFIVDVTAGEAEGAISPFGAFAEGITRLADAGSVWDILESRE